MHLRQPAVAGRFYTDVPADLRAEVESFLKQGAALPASALAAGDAAHLAGLMLPHAGHVYSGRVIGATLAHVRLPRTVFLLCPNHTGLGTPLSVWPAGAWQTPLGPVPVDGEMARLLCEADEDFSADVMGHVREHSIEVLLPFYALHAWSPDAAVRATLVMHETSAAVSHDTGHVVGYAGLRIFSC
ncbi:AmmeMemoRadiSam system protein B [Desulfovibrio sp.]|uniref:AmmeMemoRadiSam system protein B n=1 Tax=Desulfovibrio sp. TaxID=885 RepID=UPI003078841F